MLTLVHLIGAFLEANDQINTVVARFEAFQRGDLAAVASIPTTVGSTSTDNTGLSLIDLDDGPSNAVTGNSADDLTSLFGSSVSAPAPTQPPVNNATRPTISSPFPSSQRQGQQFGSIMLPGTPTPTSSPSNGSAGAKATGPSAGNMGGSSSPPVGMGISSMMRTQSPVQHSNPGMSASQFMSIVRPNPQSQSSLVGQQHPIHPPQSQPQQSGSTQNRDPFADLVGLF